MNNYYLTLDEVIDKLALSNAGYWRVSKDDRDKTPIWNTLMLVDNKDKENKNNLSFNDKAKFFSDFMRGLNGLYIVEWIKGDTPRNDDMQQLNLRIRGEGATDVEKDVSSVVSSVSSIGQTEMDLRIQGLTKDYEIRDLTREVESNKKYIAELEDKIKDLEKENRSLETKADANLWQRIEKFASVAEPYLKTFMAQKYGITAIPQVAENPTIGEVNTPEINIPDEQSNRFVLAINDWAKEEPNVVSIIENIVKLKRENPSVYAIALGQLVGNPF